MNLKQQDIPTEDLSDLGAPGARGSGLAGLLGDDDTAATKIEEPETRSPHAAQTTRAIPRADATEKRQDTEPTRNPPRKPGRPRGRVRPTSAVYVSPSVKKRFDAYRHRQKLTNLQVVLEAISSKHPELANIIRDSTFNIAPVNPLFPADPSAVRYLGGGSVQIGFSPTPQQEEKIDEIGQSLGFETRSTWIAPVLNAFLPGRKDDPPTR